MTRPFGLLVSLIGIWALHAGCKTRLEEQSDRLPWADVTFDAPVVTALAFVNESSDTLDLSVSFDWELPQLGKELPDTLWPGDSFRFTVPLYRPEQFVIHAGYRRIFYSLFPGYDRQITYGTTTNSETGNHAELYEATDSVEIWYPTSVEVGAISLSLDEFISHTTALRDTATARLNRSTDYSRSPLWLTKLLSRQVAHKRLMQIATYPAYYRFFYKQRIELPPRILAELKEQAQNDYFLDGETFQASLYNAGLYEFDTQSAKDSVREETTTDRQFAIVNYYKRLPSTPHKAAILAAHLDDQIRKGKEYADKDVLIADVLKLLPPTYANRLHQIDQRITELRDSRSRLADTSDLLALLTDPLLQRDRTTSDLLSARQKPVTLYKFWFAGCYPCLRNQPAEAALRNRFSKLEIISVAFKTAEEKWGPYLKRHNPPADAFFYVSEQQGNLIKSGMGSWGAPQYLLLDINGKVICRGCPKPGDEALTEIIGQLVSR